MALHACENDRGLPGAGSTPWSEIRASVREIPAQSIEFESYNTSFGDFGWQRGMFQNHVPTATTSCAAVWSLCAR